MEENNFSLQEFMKVMSDAQEKAKIYEIKQFMINFYLPTLRDTLKKNNPKEWKKWKECCCKQTAIFGAFIMNSLLPDYRWTVWEGQMTDKKYFLKKQSYNHAWIYGCQDKGLKIFIDLGRVERPIIFEFVDGNRYKNIPGYEDIQIIERVQLDWRYSIDHEIEYFTKMPSRTLANILFKKMKEKV